MKRSAPARRRRPPRLVSDAREAVRDERRAFVDDVLRRRLWCEACPVLAPLGNVTRPRGRAREACDVHELVRRSQGSPIVPSQGLTAADVLAVCRPCHDWITTHPEAAVALGLVRWGMRPNPPL